MIQVQTITKDFGATRALDGLSFTAKDGVAFGLLGRNGAGKTTCIRIIMDVFKADTGQVLINGVLASKGNFKIGYLPEERGLYQKRTIFEQMVYIGRLRGLSKETAARNTYLRLEELEATEYLRRKLDTLSKGNQQKIQLAIALINDPDIIILDEPFSGLDPVNAKLLKDIVRKQVDMGKIVIFSSHQMAQVEEFCDDICLIDKGQSVLSGELAQIKKSYPRNIIDFTVNEAPFGLAGTIRQHMGIGLANITEKDGRFEATLADPTQRESLYRTLAELGVIPEAFAVREPSLEDIFIEKVGGEPEPVQSGQDADKLGGKRLFGGRGAHSGKGAN
jgi:ABC-2 type transport system ATP-binding protein